MKGLHAVAFILLIIGGLNWLLVGFADYDVVAAIFGAASPIAKVIYVLVGLAAIVEVATHKKTCKLCGMGASPSM